MPTFFPPIGVQCPVVAFNCYPTINLHVFRIEYCGNDHALAQYTYGYGPLRELIDPGDLSKHPSRTGGFVTDGSLFWSYKGGVSNRGAFRVRRLVVQGGYPVFEEADYPDREVTPEYIAGKIKEKSLEKDIQFWKQLKELLSDEEIKILRKKVKELEEQEKEI